MTNFSVQSFSFTPILKFLRAFFKKRKKPSFLATFPSDQKGKAFLAGFGAFCKKYPLKIIKNENMKNFLTNFEKPLEKC